MENIIEIRNMGKKYILTHESKGAYNYTALRDVMTDNIRNLWDIIRGKRNDAVSGKREEFWALKDVSLDITEGERLGIIGRNGAGKTTLLKVLSRITEPTKGYAVISGRVSSLLEVGTGFHPELTGRENVYLNGAILGMKKTEIDRKFDEIVDFADVAKFLDTPVKRYSNGMQVRLAFSIAAHLEPEILLIDEVLAVGDAEFRKKCVGKMDEVSKKQGRTILFVSHNMATIRGLCDRAVLLENGKIVKDGVSSEVTSEYEKRALSGFGQFTSVRKRNMDEVKNKDFYIDSVEIFNEQGKHANLFKYNERLHLILNMQGESPDYYHMVFRIYNERGEMLFSGASAELHEIYFEKQVKTVKIEIGPLLFTAGTYKIELLLRTGRIQGGGRTDIDLWRDAVGFHLNECIPFETSWNMEFPRDGLFVVKHSFERLDG